MYLYEMIWILIGVMAGMGIGWWIMKSENLVKVGWAVCDLDANVLHMDYDRDTLIAWASQSENAAYIRPIFMKTYESPLP